MATGADFVLVGGRSPSGDPLGSVAVEDGRLAARGRGPTIDLNGLIVAPGYIDIQVNGGFGLDFTTDPTHIWSVGSGLPGWGVTSFVPTLVSTTLDVVDAAIEVVRAGPPPGYRGAEVLGLHIEGPFLAPTRHGAHDPSLLRTPEPRLVSGWSAAGGVRMVTIAPELPGALDTIAALVAGGVTVSLGHSDATFEQAMAGFDAGASMVTHLFNAMSGTAHRTPGLAAAALAHPTAVAGLIADGHHVLAGAVRMARAALGDDRIALVTDAVAVTGSTEATTLGSVEIAVEGGAPRTPDGTLAGSLLTTDLAVRTYRALAGAGDAEAVDAASRVPALALGLGDRGLVEPGRRADLVVLDAELEVVATVAGGAAVYGAERIGLGQG